MNPMQLTDAQRDAVESLARKIVQLGLTAPAIFALESVRPLGRLLATSMTAIHPYLDALLPAEKLLHLRDVLEKPEGIETILQRIEALDREGRNSTSHERSPH